MPIFEFECTRCGERFEELLFKPSDEKKLKCPKCSGSNLRKLLSAFGFKSGSKVVSSVSGAGESCTTCSAKTCDTCH